jgi:4'-phosphopantetheinyl transferase
MGLMMSLSPGEGVIDLRHGRVDGASPRLLAFLSAEEQAKADRFAFAHDRDSYVAAHALTRATLSEFFPRAPQDWTFAKGDHGKPRVDAGDESTRLSFNLSHTRGHVALAVAIDRDVGVDVERIAPDRADEAVARHLFAPAEFEAFRGAPEGERGECFFDFWTLKEAYIKAVGLGVALPLRDFAFTREPLRISFAAGLDDIPSRWLFRRFRPAPGIAMALAARRGQGAEPVVKLREVEIAAL